jgi:hypothetical protein
MAVRAPRQPPRERAERSRRACVRAMSRARSAVVAGLAMVAIAGMVAQELTTSTKLWLGPL